MDDCLHKRKNGTCEILSEKDGVQEFCVEGPCPHDTPQKGDYIKRKDAMIMRFRDGYDKSGIVYVPLRDVIKHLKNIPADDVVEVVRCKDCQWYDASDHLCNLYGNRHFDGFYCHDGERGADNG